MKNLLFILLFLSSFVMAQDPITIQVENDAQSVGELGATILVNEITKSKRDQKNLAVILPTGSTPKPMYATLVKWFYEGKVDFSKTQFFNLDEYVGLDADNPNSYAYFLNTQLYHLITPGLNLQKLKFFGLNHLEKKDCLNKKDRLKLNESIDRFCTTLVDMSKEGFTAIEALEKCFQKLKKSDRDFLKLFSGYMNDRNLPSYKTLKGLIEKDTSLRSLAALDKNIHQINGASCSEDEVNRYHSLVKEQLDNPNTRVICFSGIGRNPPHIAFNEFITEDLFLSESLSERDKNKIALRSEMRLVPLAEGTRAANARFFNDSKDKVPTHALTLGLSEIFDCDRIVVMACGSEKMKPLYNSFSKNPSYNASISLLKLYNKGELLILLDKEAFGLSEKDSLFALSTLGLLNDPTFQTKINFASSRNLSFWQIPKSKKDTLLDKGYKIKNNDISLATIPENKNILWVKEGKMHYSLWQKLKEAKNNLSVSQKSDLNSILTNIDKANPDIIILPHTFSVLENFSQLKSEIQKKYPDKPILGIFYETDSSINNVFFPLSKEEQKNKTQIIHKFHFTQVSRSKFDLISEEMSNVTSSLSPFNEWFSFCNLKIENQEIKLIPFSERLFISKSFEKVKKHDKHAMFSFDLNDAVTFISPHPDDAEISAGALIRQLGKQKIKTHVLNATSGHNALIKKESVLKHPFLPDDILEQAKCENSEYIESKVLKSRIRECESLGALSYLNQDISIQNLRLPFYEKGSLTDIDTKTCDLAIENSVQNAKRLFFFLPYPQDKQLTHRKVSRLFIERICNYYKRNPHLDIIIAFYPTPWTGGWNMYDYSYTQGSKFAALTGGEILAGHGNEAIKPELLGGILAKRYQLFYFND